MNIDNEEIITKDDFLCFLSDLILSLKNTPDEWENKDLPSYLEAMTAWIEDMEGYYLNQKKPIPENINWDIFRNILLAARVYE